MRGNPNPNPQTVPITNVMVSYGFFPTGRRWSKKTLPPVPVE